MEQSSEQASRRTWRDVAAEQTGVVTRAQLRTVGVDADMVAHRVRSERWQQVTSTVVATFTGVLTREQTMWAGVLHGGKSAALGGLTAGERAGLKNWHRDEVTVYVPYGDEVPPRLDGVVYVRTRRDLDDLLQPDSAPRRCRLEPSLLMFGARDRSARTAQGVLAAAVQQRLTTPGRLLAWIDDLTPLRRASLLRSALYDMEGGSQSLAEIDIKRMCRVQGLALPSTQVRRRDASGHVRYIDCHWRLAGGRTIELEIDGAFHMDAEQWEDDIARQRSLSDPNRLIVRCTARELRDDAASLARDLRRLGVPSARAVSA